MKIILKIKLMESSKAIIMAYFITQVHIHQKISLLLR